MLRDSCLLHCPWLNPRLNSWISSTKKYIVLVLSQEIPFWIYCNTTHINKGFSFHIVLFILAVPIKPCQKQSNGAWNKILNFIQLMTICQKSSNSTDTTVGKFSVITILMTVYCFWKMQRYITHDGCYAFCLFIFRKMNKQKA